MECGVPDKQKGSVISKSFSHTFCVFRKFFKAVFTVVSLICYLTINILNFISRSSTSFRKKCS